MRKLINIICMVLFLIPSSDAQIVETIYTHSKIADGLYVDHSGHVYTTSGGLSNGKEIGKYDIFTETYDPYFASGFSGPINIARYQDSLFIVTNYDNSTAYSYHLYTKEIKVIASNLDGPAGIAIDGNDNIYITNWGQSPAWAGHQIHKISPSGEVSVFVDSNVLYRPQGITINNEGTIIVHSQKKLYKVNPLDGSIEFWVNLGDNIGNMTFRKKENCVYGASNQGHKILKITPNGDVITFAGSTVGFKDGDVSTALFNSPLGIGFTASEDTLYIGEGGNSKKLRRIIMDPTVSVEDQDQGNIEIYPNPSQNIFNINRGTSEKVSVEIYNKLGQLVFSKVEESERFSIDLSQQSIGSYYLHLKTKDYTQLEKLIKY